MMKKLLTFKKKKIRNFPQRKNKNMMIKKIKIKNKIS